MFGGWGSSKPATGTPVGGTVTGTPVSGYPAMGGAGGGSFKPAPGAAMPTMPVKYGGAAAGGAAAGGMGSAFSSSGYRRFGGGSSIMPFAMGAFAGTAAYALLSSNRDARCNGVKPECYRSLCVQSQKDCPLAAGKPLTLARCPANLGSQFTECWATKDLSFLCAGVGRPSTSVNMDALCAPDNKSKSNDTSLFDLNPTGAGLSTSPQGTIIGPNGVELFPMNRNGAAQRGVSGAAAVLSAAAGVFMLL